METKALFATVDGTIGIVASLSEDKFLLLEKVEKRMEEHDMSLGGIEHARYPSHLTSPSRQALSWPYFCVRQIVMVDGAPLRMDGRKR